MRGMDCRGLRRELVAAAGITLFMPALVWAAQSPRTLATQTTLGVEIHDVSGRTQASVSVKVTGEDGLPATGAIALTDHGRALAGVALDDQGQANTVLKLAGGDHLLRAAYQGDTTHRSSVSDPAAADATSTGTPSFTTSISPTSISLTAGQSGNMVVSVTPVNASSLSSPMFVTLSCSGLPDQASCTYNPATVEILPGATDAVTSLLAVQTQSASNAASSKLPHGGATPVAWAFLLPGALVLGGIAWGARRRAWLSRVALVALVGYLSVLGTTACNPRYNYLNHGPVPNPGTPVGSYTITVDAQSSNGVTAITDSNTTFALTVN